MVIDSFEDEKIIRRKFGNPMNPDLVLQIVVDKSNTFIVIDKKEKHGFQRLEFRWDMWEELVKHSILLKERARMLQLERVDDV